MRTVKIETLISKSIARAKLILFQQFSLKKWLCLLLIASLAGALGGGGNGGGNGFQRPPKRAEAAQVESLQEIPAEGALASEYAPQEYDPAGAFDQEQIDPEPEYGTCPLRQDRKYPWVWLAAIAVISAALLVVALALVFTWLGARFKFVWFEAITKNDASIKAPFHEYKKEGNSLFKFFLILIPVILLLFAAFGIWFYFIGEASGIFRVYGEPGFGQLISVFALPGLTALSVLILMIILGTCIDHFVVTIMAMDRCGFVAGWKKFSAIAKSNLKDLSIFFLVLLGLSIATGILAMIIVLVLLLAVFLAGGAFFGLLYLLLAVALKAKAAFAVLAVLLAVPAIACIVLLLMSVGLPFAVFFRSLSLYYFTALDCGYAPLALEENQAVQQMGEA